MFQFVLAASVALSSESIDGIFSKKSSSCSGGSCSAPTKPVEVSKAKPTEEIASPKSSTCGASTCGSKRPIRSSFRRCR